MCIAVFLWQSHPFYPLILLLNRDEYHNRPTKSLAWWEGREILGGRDGLAGGTWLACDRNGRLAFVTNVREILSVPEAKSRGDLPVRFLESKKNPLEFAEEVKEEAHQYNGFNLIVADICSKSMVYITNRPKGENISVAEVSPGIHVLSNASLDFPWPKAQRLRQSFQALLDKYGEGDVPIKKTVEELMMDTTKDDDESKLPHIYTPDFEYQLSSIFVDTDRRLGHYGTRSTCALTVKSSGEVSFYERCLEMGVWKEDTLGYQIEKMQ